MKFNTSFKKFACLLLAILMLLGTVGCKDNGKTKKKKKVIVKKQVIVQDNDDGSNTPNNSPVIIPTDTNKDEEEKKSLPERPLPEVSEDTGYVEWQEPFVPEFDYEYADLSITKDYVIVYALEKWDNRKESRNEDGTDRYINYTGNARISAYDLQKWFKENLGLKLDVKKDTEVDASTKKILVGDTAYYKSSLAENEFAVKVKGDDLVFEGGHFVMVTKAAKWFETVEVKEGKVATLSGKSDDFKSQVTLNGVTYDYVWGDEFDGYEFLNTEKWIQSPFGDERADDYVSLNNNPDFHYVENGRLHLTADRYYNESYPGKGYASSGDTNTQGVMEFRNGYVEFRARMPYRRGAFPALWTMSNNKNKDLPNYNYDDGYGQISKVFWIIEFDLFEAFADTDHATTTIHKWYTESMGKTTNHDATKLTDDQVKMVFQRAYDEGYASEVSDWDMSNYGLTEEYLEKVAPKKDGKYYIDRGILMNDKKEFIYYPVKLEHDDGTVVDLINYQKRPFTNMSAGMMTNSYSYYYIGTDNYKHKNPVDGIYDWAYYFDSPETLNQEYHVYSYLYTSDHCTVYMDGEMYVDFDWDPTFDMTDVDGDGIIDDPTANAAGVSNNGVGYNVWHYFLIDNMIYPPGDKSIAEEKKLQKGDYPFNLYVDWVRVYQDLDDPSQALWFPNGEAD